MGYEEDGSIQGVGHAPSEGQGMEVRCVYRIHSSKRGGDSDRVTSIESNDGVRMSGGLVGWRR